MKNLEPANTLLIKVCVLLSIQTYLILLDSANTRSKITEKHHALSASPSKPSPNRNLSKSSMKAVWPQESSEGKYSILDFL